MDDIFDREKVVDCMFDPVTSSIISELEDGEKECSFLANKFAISENEILERLSYLLEHHFIFKNNNHGKTLFSANNEKLSKIIENNDTFDAAIEGLEKMDSYLN